MTKDLAEKAIDFKGKKYVLVSDRVIYFNETYPTGMIKTELLSEPNAEMVVVKAIITPDTTKPERTFTGHSQSKWGEGFINKTSAMENAETSAVGRALALMGIGVLDSIASIDEVNKATYPVQDEEWPTDEEPKAPMICAHTGGFKFAQSHSIKNPDRWFRKCAKCGEFIGWAKPEEIPQN